MACKQKLNLRRVVATASQHLGCRASPTNTRIESSIKRFDPYFICLFVRYTGSAIQVPLQPLWRRLMYAPLETMPP